MIPRSSTRTRVDDDDDSNNANITNVLTLASTVTVTGKNYHDNTTTYADADHGTSDSVDTFYALAAPNASHRVVLLEMQVSGQGVGQNQTHHLDSSGRGKVAVREIAHLEGLGYGDEFTERLCEGDGVKGEDGDEDEDKGEGAGGYVLVAALVGANRKAIYRVPLTAPRSQARRSQTAPTEGLDERKYDAVGVGSQCIAPPSRSRLDGTRKTISMALHSRAFI